MLRVVSSPPVRGAYFEHAAELARTEGYRLLGDGGSVRVLHVVEFKTPDGSWRPMCGDAYLDEDEAVSVAKGSERETRVVVYEPRRAP